MSQFFENLFKIDEKVALTQEGMLINMIIGLIAGIIIAAGYVLAFKGKKFSKQFVITLLLLPIVMTVVIPLISTDLKKAVSLAGIFALVRFRSIPGDSKDITYVFFTIAVGIAISLNYYIAAFVLVFVVSLIFIILERKITVAEDEILKITIPEDMNYKGTFDDIFEKYLDSYKLRSVKTTNMGTLFMLSYTVKPKKDADIKALIDEIRTRNGNLTVIISEPEITAAQL